jgi:hypothetical protein
MGINWNAPISDRVMLTFFVACAVVIWAAMVGTAVTERVKNHREGRLTDPSREPSLPTDEGCLLLGMVWLLFSLCVGGSFPHLSYWGALAWGVPVTVLICGTPYLTYRLAVWALTLLVLRIGSR